MDEVTEKGIEETSEQKTKKCNQTCWPLIVYIIITVILLIALLATPQIDAMSKSIGTFITLAWSLFWGFILWVLCRNCQRNWAWIIMFIPFILNVLFFIVVLLAVGVFDTGGTFPDIISLKNINKK